MILSNKQIMTQLNGREIPRLDHCRLPISGKLLNALHAKMLSKKYSIGLAVCVLIKLCLLVMFSKFREM